MDTATKRVLANIKIITHDTGRSANSVALASGIPWSSYERKLNRTGDFKLTELARIADALGVNPGILYKEDVSEALKDAA